ncbi:uncharacterized protein LOC117651222 [Thrips palmi]|uniref:Uncharacterized protein LOC117651222 n=1 Tax=Thrips palmi TaxID=161013 RepID=A0A6P8ZZR2_THRPL|nr:uncharacterized protein LOC117651222 [Thrips palmi]
MPMAPPAPAAPASGDAQSESQAQFAGYDHHARPRPLAKRHSTNLKLEGDLSAVPEYRDAYVEVRGAQRPALIRPRPNLMPAQGEMSHETEKSASFVDYHNNYHHADTGLTATTDSLQRPPMKRHPTNMRIEHGQHGQHGQPDGDHVPEYRASFREYGNVRNVIRRPEPHVTLGGTMSGGPAAADPLPPPVVDNGPALQAVQAMPPALPPVQDDATGTSTSPGASH